MFTAARASGRGRLRAFGAPASLAGARRAEAGAPRAYEKVRRVPRVSLRAINGTGRSTASAFLRGMEGPLHEPLRSLLPSPTRGGSRRRRKRSRMGVRSRQPRPEPPTGGESAAHRRPNTANCRRMRDRRLKSYARAARRTATTCCSRSSRVVSVALPSRTSSLTNSHGRSFHCRAKHLRGSTKPFATTRRARGQRRIVQRSASRSPLESFLRSRAWPLRIVHGAMRCSTSSHPNTGRRRSGGI